jgi:hypothetical protein
MQAADLESQAQSTEQVRVKALLAAATVPVPPPIDELLPVDELRPDEVPADLAWLLRLLPRDDVYLQDEVEVALHPTLTRVWCAKGRRGQRLVELLRGRDGVDRQSIHQLVHLLAAEQAVQREARSTPSPQPSTADIENDTRELRTELRWLPQTVQSEKGLRQSLLRGIGGQAGVGKAALACNEQHASVRRLLEEASPLRAGALPLAHSPRQLRADSEEGCQLPGCKLNAGCVWPTPLASGSACCPGCRRHPKNAARALQRAVQRRWVPGQ